MPRRVGSSRRYRSTVRRDPADWTTVVPERDVVLGGLTVAGDELLVVATSNAVDSVERWSPDGTLLGAIGDPSGIGVASVVSMSADRTTGRGVVVTVGFDAPFRLWPLGPPSSVPESGEAPTAKTAGDPAARRQPGDVPVARRDRDRDVPDPPRRRRAGARHPDDPQRLRRVRHRRDAGVVADDRRVVRAGRAVRDRRPAGRDRARRGVARRRAPGEQAERVRRLPRRRRLVGGDRAHVARAAGDRRTVERRAAGRCGAHAAARPVRARCRAVCRCST